MGASCRERVQFSRPWVPQTKAALTLSPVGSQTVSLTVCLLWSFYPLAREGRYRLGNGMPFFPGAASGCTVQLIVETGLGSPSTDRYQQANLDDAGPVSYRSEVRCDLRSTLDPRRRSTPLARARD